MPAQRKVIGNKNAGAVTLEALRPFFHYLKYTISVDGAAPLFVLVDADLSGIDVDGPPDFSVKDTAASDTVLLSSDGAPRKTYVRKWPQDDDELDAMESGKLYKHVIGMSFLKAVKYRIKIERFDIDDTPLGILKEVEWSSQTPDSESFEPFTINVARKRPVA